MISPKQIADCIFDTITSHTGTKESDGWFIYKTDLVNNKGQPRYLRIGIDQYGSINAAHPYNRRIIQSKINNLPYLGEYL